MLSLTFTNGEIRKMKYFLVLFALVSTGTYAQNKPGLLKQVSGQKYGMAGCGLGSIVFGNDAGFVQVFAATTNGTSGNQTFGISSGTSNCTAASGASASRAADYVIANRIQIETDAARGQGESIDALATLGGCDSKQLASSLQSGYGKIFEAEASNETVSSRVVEQLSVCSAG